MTSNIQIARVLVTYPKLVSNFIKDYKNGIVTTTWQEQAKYFSRLAQYLTLFSTMQVPDNDEKSELFNTVLEQIQDVANTCDEVNGFLSAIANGKELDHEQLDTIKRFAQAVERVDIFLQSI